MQTPSGDSQTCHVAGLVLCCKIIGGPESSQRSMQCWAEALTEAKRHQDIYLEADVTERMGDAAKEHG